MIAVVSDVSELSTFADETESELLDALIVVRAWSTLLEEFERFEEDDVRLAGTEPPEPTAVAMLDEELERLVRLVFTPERAESTLDDDCERLADDVWFVVSEELSVLSVASTLDEELLKSLELVSTGASAASTLLDDLDKLREEV